MSAVGSLNTFLHGIQPFTHHTEPCRRKLCCLPWCSRTEWKSKTACGSSRRQHHASCRRRTFEKASQVEDQPVLEIPKPQVPGNQSTSALLPALSLAVANTLLHCAPAIAFTIHQEPENALSFPTWVIHISSVIEWAIAMSLVWKYAEVTGNAKWKGLTWGMMPLLGGALCACTYHFFYNSSDLDFLVAVQASLTWIGNATCAAAAYRIYKSSQQEGAA